MKIATEYARLRRLGWKAIEAFDAAKVRAAFLDAGDCVELEVVPDLDADLSFLNQDCFADCAENERDRANREGCWGVVAKAYGETVDSVWGFIGDDWKDSGYDVDLMRAALRAVEPTPATWMAI